MRKAKKKLKGFTLIELVIVIAILALLMAIAIPKYQKSNLSAQATAHNANVRILKNAGMLYVSDHPEMKEDGPINDGLAKYLEKGKMPKPAKGTGAENFTVTYKNGNIEVSPGEVEVNDDKIVEVNGPEAE
ncbi:type II secretion system GspH family protein [Peptoniphilus sp. KCTC 25270]|uniref:type II secretion system protein n=1 Tax=Peptoniphilus sp. KCTC 25270 TaxID=2897414 RepID=UPI001E60DC4B|nr:type II secretion system protein [Peptoniphilus sp. KCTC 25270]MCD1147076.1 type II secretion system GspH family protein [Peptoniphilus sp. KCTC 25270]